MNTSMNDMACEIYEGLRKNTNFSWGAHLVSFEEASNKNGAVVDVEQNTSGGDVLITVSIPHKGGSYRIDDKYLIRRSGNSYKLWSIHNLVVSWISWDGAPSVEINSSEDVIRIINTCFNIRKGRWMDPTYKDSENFYKEKFGTLSTKCG